MCLDLPNKMLGFWQPIDLKLEKGRKMMKKYEKGRKQRWTLQMLRKATALGVLASLAGLIKL